MARQSGEKIAADSGFTTFPVDPFAIAAKEDILVEAKDPDRKGMSGCIVFNDESASSMRPISAVKGSGGSLLPMSWATTSSKDIPRKS